MAYHDLALDKQKAIELLVMGDSELPGKRMKYQDIAEACGVHELTLRRWRQDPEFNEAREEFRKKIAKADLIDEAVMTLRRAMRTKDSTNAAEIALKYLGEMVERRELTGQMTNVNQIDLKGASQAVLIERIIQLQKQLGMPTDMPVGDIPSPQIVEIVHPDYGYVDDDKGKEGEKDGDSPPK